MEKIGFGGSCHWCTEAIFRSLNGVSEVLQGWIASENPDGEFSEAVIVSFDPAVISLETLIALHLHSHSCTAEHAMRGKYRSAVYVYHEVQAQTVKLGLEGLQSEFEKPIITKVIPFKKFKLNKAEYLDYYYSDPEKPFCQNYISPKLKLLRERFGSHITGNKIPAA